MKRISKDDIRTLIVVLLVCIICVILVLILNIKSNTDKMKEVTEYNTFFSVVNHINNYITNISSMQNKKVYDLLDKEYKIQNNLTENNIFDIIETYEENISVKVTKMEYVKVKKGYVYYVKANLIQNLLDNTKLMKENFKIIVITDFENNTVSIYPVDNNDYKKIVNGVKKINIEKNANNKVEGTKLITKEQICVLYLSDYIDKIVNDFDSAYNLLEENMKKIYPTIDSYKEFINNNENKIILSADKCKIDEIDNKRVYTVIDDKKNMYRFIENSVMNYKVEIYIKEEDS